MTTAAAMAERRGWTTAVRRWRPRQSEKGRGRVSLSSSEPNAHGYAVYGGGTRPSHDDGRGGEAPASLRTTLALTVGCQRAREEAGGWRWSATVVMEWLGASLCTVMATAELRELGGCCWRCETTKEERGKRTEGAGRCGRVLA